jgi:hypothetical protein
MFLETRACGPRSLKVIFESSRSFRAYNTKIKIYHFFITVKDTDMKYSETYFECYRQYMHYIKYGPWGQPHPQKLGKIAECIKNY